VKENRADTNTHKNDHHHNASAHHYFRHRELVSWCSFYNVTVFATDEFGNVDASNILFFNANAPEFPVVPLVTASVIAAVSVVACIGVLVFRRKNKQSKEQNILG